MPKEIEGEVWKKIVVQHSDVFPIGVGGDGKGEASEILSLTGEKSVSLDEVINEFMDKKSWRDLVEKDNDFEEDGTDYNVSEGVAFVAGKAIEVTMNDLMTLMVCVAVGVFSRLQRMNVQNEYVTPLRVSIQKWFE
jgi:hypothetical protein